MTLIVSFATNDSHYLKYANRLRQNCDQHGLQHHIEVIQSFGTKRDHCAYKPSFILEMLDVYQRQVLWVDVDSVIQGQIELPENIDCGFCDNVYRKRQRDPFQVTGGAVAFGNTVNARQFLEHWRDDCEQGEEWDHPIMDRLASLLPESHKTNITPYLKNKITLFAASGKSEMTV